MFIRKILSINVGLNIALCTSQSVVKNDLIRVSIRSRGPEINQVAEKYHGGGHKFASGVKFKSFDEAMKLVDDLDLTVKKYRETQEVE